MVTLASLSPCSSTGLIQSSKLRHPITFPLSGFLNLRALSAKNGQRKRDSLHGNGRFTVLAVTEGSAKKKSSRSKEDDDGEQNDASIPSWAKPGSDEPPPWARDESQSDTSGLQVPYIVYLLASAVAAIAAIGSIFEYINQRPVFGVVASDSVFYVPLLGFFVFTGIPTSAFLWFKSVEVANKEAEEQDRRDGYL